jgi:hypothetical protein
MTIHKAPEHQTNGGSDKWQPVPQGRLHGKHLHGQSSSFQSPAQDFFPTSQAIGLWSLAWWFMGIAGTGLELKIRVWYHLGMFQGRDFGREVASPSLGGRPAISKLYGAGPVGAHLIELTSYTIEQLLGLLAPEERLVSSIRF